MIEASLINAIRDVDAAAVRLGMKDKWGDPLLPDETLAVVASWTGNDWDENIARFCSGERTPEEYKIRALRMINIYETDRFRRRADAKLSEMITRDGGA